MTVDTSKTLPQYRSLFEPIALGPKVLPNRFYQVPHCGTGDLRPATQAAFRGMKAEGGWGAVCVESTSIHPETDHWPLHLARLWDESDVHNLAAVTSAIHAHGSLAGIELWYGGVNSLGLETRAVPRAPSQIAHPFTPWVIPQEMLLSDIRDVRNLFAVAAERAVRAGFDIVYVYGAHGQGPMQFLSSSYNRRSDEYGGSLENRARFWLECLSVVREAVGDACAVTTRIAVDDMGSGGVSLDESLEFIGFADGLVDFWDVNIGSLDWSNDIGSSRFFPENWQSQWTSKVRPYTSHPIVCVGRFTSPDTMVGAIASGQCDIIGAARPSIADPFLPAKIAENRIDDIRECIGCNVCISRWAQGGAPVVCTQNATAGEEYRRGWHPEVYTRAANSDETVLVIGAGPAGMECARVLGLREMSGVHLIESSPDVGGSLAWITELPRLSHWKRVIDYRRSQIDRLKNVTTITKTTLTADDVRAYGASLVVVATGSHWSEVGLSGFTGLGVPGASASEPHIVTPEQLMKHQKPVGKRVLVYDCDGYVMAAAITEKLASEGHVVTYVTPSTAISEYTKFTAEDVLVRRLFRERDVTVITEALLDSVEPGRAAIRSRVDGEMSDLEVDTVVLVTQRVSDDALYRELVTGPAPDDSDIAGVFRIGDCVAPRMVADCVFDGHRLAREIDSADPSQMAPFIREIRQLGGYTDADYDGQLAPTEIVPGSTR